MSRYNTFHPLRYLPFELREKTIINLDYQTLISFLSTSKDSYDLVNEPISFFKNWTKNQTSNDLVKLVEILLLKKLSKKYLHMLNANYFTIEEEKKVIPLVCKFGGEEEVISFLLKNPFIYFRDIIFFPATVDQVLTSVAGLAAKVAHVISMVDLRNRRVLVQLDQLQARP